MIKLDLFGYRIDDIHNIVDDFIYENIKLQKKEVEILTRTNKSEIKQIIAEILINYDLEYKECSYNPSLLKISI
mgnify:CR=1 FL=1|jgi:hypothetical protein|tara:strand:- start:16204 stop:16425 length:222 start_codon:yes stop_codon:yes gene_type:complete